MMAIAASSLVCLPFSFMFIIIGTHDESFLNGVNADFETMIHGIIDRTNIGNREKSQ